MSSHTPVKFTSFSPRQAFSALETQTESLSPYEFDQMCFALVIVARSIQTLKLQHHRVTPTQSAERREQQ